MYVEGLAQSEALNSFLKAMSNSSIPIRVIPGNTEMVKDNSTGAYHLNVGFHLSFNVKDLMQSLAGMTGTDVVTQPIMAGASAPINQNRETPQQPPPPNNGQQPSPAATTKPDVGLGGPLKKVDGPKRDQDITWETKLLHLVQATTEYRKTNSYEKSSATFFRAKDTGDSAKSPAGGAAEEGAEPRVQSQERMNQTMGEDCATQ